MLFCRWWQCLAPWWSRAPSLWPGNVTRDNCNVVTTVTPDTCNAQHALPAPPRPPRGSGDHTGDARADHPHPGNVWHVTRDTCDTWHLWHVLHLTLVTCDTCDMWPVPSWPRWPPRWPGPWPPGWPSWPRPSPSPPASRRQRQRWVLLSAPRVTDKYHRRRRATAWYSAPGRSPRLWWARGWCPPSSPPSPRRPSPSGN